MRVRILGRAGRKLTVDYLLLLVYLISFLHFYHLCFHIFSNKETKCFFFPVYHFRAKALVLHIPALAGFQWSLQLSPAPETPLIWHCPPSAGACWEQSSHPGVMSAPALCEDHHVLIPNPQWPQKEIIGAMYWAATVRKIGTPHKFPVKIHSNPLR